MLLRYMTRFANVIAIFVVLQALFFAALVYGLRIIYFPAGIALIALSVFCTLYVATGESHPVYRLAWVTVIMLIPVIGGVVYIFCKRESVNRLVVRSHSKSLKRALTYEFAPKITQSASKPAFPDNASLLIARYLKNAVGFSPAETRDCAYFPVGEEKIAYLMNAMTKAKKYIFLEYFIIEEGVVWDSIYNILRQKAAEGIDVRLICDGAGCLYPLPWRFVKHMAEAGIKVRKFNPVRPFVSPRINSRNHRKIAVIDGITAFCGGLNLADQYANVKEMYGHFKDSAVMVDGATAWNMTLLFLSMWEFIGKSKHEIAYEDFIPALSAKPGGEPGETLCIPMLDIPKDGVAVSEHTFINFISRAEKYVYVTTPYLMCGGEILAALYTAAQSGIDVRIITPYVADKKMVKRVTESYYRLLLRNKVRVFEYLPGFIHAKNVIADGKRAMVGTVNLDYRSLYLHYECGICFFGGKIVRDIDGDFHETLAQCREVTFDDLKRFSPLKRAIQRICRLFAPFL